MKRMLLILILLAVISSAKLITCRLFLPRVRVALELSETAPLSALATITTPRPTKVSLRLGGQDDNDLEMEFPGYSSHHELPVLGLYPDWENNLSLIMETADGHRWIREITVVTAPLPAEYPEMIVTRHLPDRITPGMIFLQLGWYDDDGRFSALTSAVDDFGRVRWYYAGEIGHVLKRLENGNFLVQHSGESTGKGDLHGNEDQVDRLVEIDLLGRIVGIRAEVRTGIHHDAAVMPDGSILVLTSAPGSYDDGVLEVDGTSGSVKQGWDFRQILDPKRPPQPRNLAEQDWLHLNGIEYDPRDDSFLVSGRDQSAVVKIDRESGGIVWILGSHDLWKPEFSRYLLDPQPDGTTDGNDGSGQSQIFAWPWGQHAPMVHPDDSNRVLIYDNGNFRSYDDPLEPQESWSRAVEYRIDQKSMEIAQVWEFGRAYGSQLFTPFIGDADYLPGGNRLVCFGGITRALDDTPMELFNFESGTVNRMKISARIIEVTDDYPAREVLTIDIADRDSTSYRGYRSYRAQKLPLYP